MSKVNPLLRSRTRRTCKNKGSNSTSLIATYWQGFSKIETSLVFDRETITCHYLVLIIKYLIFTFLDFSDDILVGIV